MIEIVNTVDAVRQQVRLWRKEGATIGFVPTMGALHAGHCSLIEASAKACDYSVVSIYVNPTQFAPHEDFKQYPKTLDADAIACDVAGADLIFAPSDNEMYGQMQQTYVAVTDLSTHLCGASRPYFFGGVCTVVVKLLNIVLPDVVYFGQKDAQQLAVIKRMVYDLNMAVTIEGCPIVREADGLAMSSRNQYLTDTERAEALCLYRSLNVLQKMIDAGVREIEDLRRMMTEEIARSPSSEIDYISFVDNKLLQPVGHLGQETLVALAVNIGQTRLIDNIVLDPYCK